MSKFTIKISATLNGKACKNPQVEFIQGAGCIYPCEIKDNEITIETLPGSTDCNCIEGYIKCDDTCLNCPPQHFKKCFCDTTDDCQDCETCIGGLCQSDCPDKLCINDTCCDCAVTEDCPKGFVCNGCGCNCIGSINANGECVQCKTKGDCKACENCIDGKCVPLECPNNLTCVNGGCGCPAGTKYDPVTNSCISIVCNDDKECGSCETCLSNNCVPINCPAGTKAVITNGVCTCIEWPCVNVTCENGADCGEGCGCKDGECVPCKYLLCNTDVADDLCTRALGCECDAAQKCQAVGGCGQYCDGFNPCSTPGCTCYENTCVACENFSCDNDECAEKVGCTCKNGKCEAKGCNNEPCSSTANCGVGCVCEGGHCVDGPCSGSCSDSSGCAGENCICVDGQCEQSPDGCKDSFTITKDCGAGDAGCKLTAKLTTKGCPCDPITLKINNPTNSNGVLTFNTTAYKNDIQPYSTFKTNENFGDNEFLSGVVEYRVDIYNKKGGTILSSSTPKSTPNASNVFSQVPIDTASFAGKYVVITVTSKGIKTVNNSCTAYGDEEIGTYVFDYTSETAKAASNANATKAIVQNKVTDKISNKKPLFIWSRTSAANFRKIYPQGSEGNYTDVISSKADGLILGDSYIVKTDCAGCTSPVATHSNLEFCCFDPTVTTSNCNTKVTIVSKPVCAVVKDQAKNYVAINGEEIDITEPITINSEFPGGIDSIISYIKGAVTQCSKTHPLGDETAPAPSAVPTCGSPNTTIKITAPAGRVITELYMDGQRTNYSGTSFDVVVPFFTGEKTFKAVYAGGCFVEFKVPGCTDKIIPECTSPTNTCTSKTGKGSFKARLESAKDVTFELTGPSSYKENRKGTQVEWTGLESGTYTVSVVGDQSISSQSCTINNKKFVDITFTGGANLCDTSVIGSPITLTATSSNVVGVVKYIIKKGGAKMDSGDIVIGTPKTYTATTTGTYTIEITTANTADVIYCAPTNSIVISNEKKTIYPQISLAEGGCVNKDILFTITGISDGAALSDVDISVSSGTLVGTPVLSNGSITGYIKRATPGTITLVIAQKQTGSCFTFATKTDSIDIKQAPSIVGQGQSCTGNGTTRTIVFNVNNNTGGTLTIDPANGSTLSTTNNINYSGTGTYLGPIKITATVNGCESVVELPATDCQETPCTERPINYLVLYTTDVCTDGGNNITSLGSIVVTKASFEAIFGVGSWANYSCRFTNTNGLDVPFNLSGLPNDEINMVNLPDGFYGLEFRLLNTSCYYTKTYQLPKGCCADNPCEVMEENSPCLNVVDSCGNPVTCTCPEEFPCNFDTGRCGATPPEVLGCVCGGGIGSDCDSICYGEFGPRPGGGSYDSICGPVGDIPCACVCS